MKEGYWRKADQEVRETEDILIEQAQKASQTQS
jgi:hypothetical protein